MARMPRARRDEPDPTVSMLVVVPAHERQDPRAGRLQGGKALSGIRRPIFTGPEERFGERVIVADTRPTIRGQDPQALQRARSVAPFKAEAVVEKLRTMKLTKAAELVQEGVADTLAYYAFPSQHWRSIRTNNPLERILREIRRRTRVVGAFPDGQSALMLCAARLRHIAGTRWGTKRYLSMELLTQCTQEMTVA